MVSDHPRKRHAVLAGSLAIVAFIGYSESGRTEDPGEQIFNSSCFACHTIGGGRLVGPDLAGVHERRPQLWLERFVISSQSMVKSGDPAAVALFEEFNNIPMPDTFLSVEQSQQVLDYIKSQSPGQTADNGTEASPSLVADPPMSEAPASKEDILAGQNMFQGKRRLVNGGPPCNACHEVRHDAVIGGGILARELTAVFSRMGGQGVKAILGRAPFPVMQAAYEDRPLTETEVSALVAFLEFADSQQYNQMPRDYGIGLFLSGVAGAAVLFLIFGFVWRGRKKGTVNQSIFDRQITSISDDDN